MGNRQLNIAISGASGFIGSHLSTQLLERGHNVFPLGRKILQEDAHADLSDTLSKADVVINLAGAPIDRRWTTAYKKELYNSRIKVTQRIVDTINQLDHKPEVFISTSAVGYYPSQGSYDEDNARKGDGFLSDLCESWEAEAQKIDDSVRLVITRFGVVLSDKGGALGKMMQPVKLGISTVIGDGSQPFPWIDLVDLMRAMEHCIKDQSLHGVVNFVAPEVINNKGFMSVAAKHYGAFLTMKVPLFAFKLLLGDASAVITEGQCVLPKRLLESDFMFSSAKATEFFEKLK